MPSKKNKLYNMQEIPSTFPKLQKKNDFFYLPSPPYSYEVPQFH